MSRERTGTIDRVGDRFRVRFQMPDGDRKALGTFDTWDEADGLRLATIEALEGRGGVVLLADWGKKWLKAREENRTVRPKTLENDQSRWENHIEPHAIASMAVRAIRPGDLDDFASSLSIKKGLSRQTITHCLNLVHGMIKSAMRKGLVKADPFAAGVQVPKERRTEEPWTYAKPAEQEAILAACKGPVRHLVAFAMATGLRAGELVTLRLVDTSEDRIVIRYGAAPDQPTKSGKPRTVHLNALAKEALTAWLAGLPAYTANKRHPNGRNPLGLTFPGRHGAYRDETHVIRWEDWKAILTGARITRKFRWHDLRHTCASSLVSGWWGRRWSLEEVKEVLGHEDIDTTQRYAHLASDAIASAALGTTAIRSSIGQPIGLDRTEAPNSSVIPERDTGLEPATFGLGSRRSTN